MNKLTPNQQKALNYNDHISLTANAGSGKTFVLSKRFIEIALKERIPLNKIVAITFTEKAAAELYKKISEHVEELLNASTDSKEKIQLEGIRRQLISSNISTIHSFCLNILREFPVEAELDANFTPIDDDLSSELIELATEKVIKDGLNSTDVEIIKKLIRIFSSKNTLVRELENLVKNFAKTLFIENNIYSKSSDDISKYYDKIIIEYFEKLIGSKIIQIKENLYLINNTVLEYQRENVTALNLNRKIAQINLSQDIIHTIHTLVEIKALICTKAGKILTRGYLKNNLRDSIDLQCIEIESNLEYLKIFINYENEENIWVELSLFGCQMLYLFRKCLGLYEESKNDNGYLDYEDILYKTYNILKNSKVSNYLADKYRYLMIDEYQDTNEIQYKIFLPLLDNLKKGNLFVVGDEKQSIYMFREAELEIFQRTRCDIAKISGVKSLLKLPDSFRMKPELCLFTNILFRNIFNDPDPLFNEVSSSDLICAQSNEEPGKIEILYYDKNSLNEKSEAELVIKKIIDIVVDGTGKHKWGDIAILCRKRKPFTELEKKLTEFKVPFIILGGKEYFQRQSIYDIYNYFSFLLDNSNDAALIGLLRSPFFSLTDNDIYCISQENGKNYWQKFNASRLKDSHWGKVYTILKENTLLAMDLEFVTLLRKILNESPFIYIMSSRSDGNQEIANIEKLVSITSSYMREGYRTLYDYVNYLKESILEKEDEPQAAITDGTDAVKIMTIHQAKGLEFPVVILYKCNEITPKNIVKTKSVISDKYFGLLSKLPAEKEYFSPYQTSTINEISNYISIKKEIAEAKRLFYVGITRAKEHLIISFESNENLTLTTGSFIYMLQTALKLDFNKTNINLEGIQTYLVFNDGIYKNEDQKLLLQIPIIKTISEDVKIIAETKNVEERSINLSLLRDSIKGEIISATKYSIFRKCPLSYYYQYELGVKTEYVKYATIHKEKKGEKNNLDGELKGRIIHSMLEEIIPVNNVNHQVIIKYEEENIKVINEEDFINNITKDLNKYYESDAYKEIKAAKNYKNEYEIYIKEDDYYLHGRLDKVIFESNLIKIIDYKTDNIEPSETLSKAEQYLSQLKFYAYILSRFFADVKNYELQIIFIKNPEINIRFKMNRDDLVLIKNEISEMMESLESRTFVKNTNYCPKCGFSAEKLKCIKDN